MFIVNWLSENWFEIIRLIIMLLGFWYAYWLIIQRDKLWYKRDDRTRIKEVNEWFHENYILNGVDPVLAYIGILKLDSPLQFHGQQERFELALDKLPIIPMQPLNRLKKILGDDTIERLIIAFRTSSYFYTSHFESPDAIKIRQQTMEGLQKTEQFLSDLSHVLLSIEIEHKLETQSIKEHPNIQTYKQRCSNLSNKYPVPR
jgi:hypothetical protein